MIPLLVFTVAEYQRFFGTAALTAGEPGDHVYVMILNRIAPDPSMTEGDLLRLIRKGLYYIVQRQPFTLEQATWATSVKLINAPPPVRFICSPR